MHSLEVQWQKLDVGYTEKEIDSLPIVRLQQKVHLFVYPKNSLCLDVLVVEEVEFVDSRLASLGLVCHE